MLTYDQEVAWMRQMFDLLAEGGVWGVPRSGLIFTRRGETLVLTGRMPHDEAFGPREAQDSDYKAIKERAEEAGIAVTDEVI